MIFWNGRGAVLSPDHQGEGDVMRRRKLFGYGSRWHCWRIRRRIDRAGGVDKLAATFKPRHEARHAASERINA